MRIFIIFFMCFFSFSFSKEKKIEGFVYIGEKTYSCNGKTNKVKEYKHTLTGMVFVLIPSGKLKIYKDKWGYIAITPFLMSKYEVTQKVWKKIIKGNSSAWKGDNRPVENITKTGATYFCIKTGLKLPDQIQWVYAYKAGSKDPFYWGNKNENDYSWNKNNSKGRTHPVGQKKPNAFGLYDMAGNVWEFCSDFRGLRANCRGGSYFSERKHLSFYGSKKYIPASRSANLGFRVVFNLR